MSTIVNFTPEDQVLLREVVPLVGLAVATAGNSGIIGTFKEAVAVARGMTDAATQYPQNELIQSLIKDLSQNRPTMPNYSSTQPNVQQQIKSDALEKCRQVVALLSQKASAPEASDFKRWVISVSERVANAAKEGGFLGFGGQRVSEAEAATLKEIATVLGV